MDRTLTVLVPFPGTFLGSPLLIMQIKKRIHFSKEDIEKLSQDPRVKDVNENRLRFTLEFRKEIYEATYPNIRKTVLRQFLKAKGFDGRILSGDFLNNLVGNMKKCAPTNGAVSTSSQYDPVETKAFLLQTGKFEKRGKGISFTSDFESELFHAYPEQSIEDGLIKVGIDPKMVGNHRIYVLKRKFNGCESIPARTGYSKELIAKYSDHPYVKRITSKQFVLSETFYNQAYIFKKWNIDDILSLFEIDYTDLHHSVRVNVYYKLQGWKKTSTLPVVCNEQTLRIRFNRLKLLEEMFEEDMADIGRLSKKLSGNFEKKRLFEIIRDLQKECETGYSLSKILSLAGISRSSYYAVLKDVHYGERCSEREEQDLADIHTIEEVMNYKGFAKGSRQIYMDMKCITGKQFGRNKILRLMRKAGITSTLRQRKPNFSKLFVEQNRKENILKRKFKLYEPDMVRLTDVTYLDLNNGLRAYGSAVKDPVSNRLIDFSVSDSNDMNLVLSSLRRIQEDGIFEGTILHSDQGSLYLTDTYQSAAANMGLIQSMSKRGNCWDNAPQESFFGHFKDEVNYRSCRTLEELRMCIKEYVYYYNNERRQWNLNKMTPVAYAEYLKKMTASEKEVHMNNEREKYRKMKERAAIEAKARFETLGV